MTATVRIPTPLRPYTGGAAEIHASGATVGELLRDLTTSHSGLAPRLLDTEGQLRRFVNVYVDDTHIRSLDGLDSPVPPGAVVHIIPAVAGGRW